MHVRPMEWSHRSRRGMRWNVLFLAVAGWCGSLLVARPLPARAAEPLVGTKLLDLAVPLDEAMVAGIRRYALRAIDETAKARGTKVRAMSVEERRRDLQAMLGIVDARVQDATLRALENPLSRSPDLAADGDIMRWVEWDVLPGVKAGGVWISKRDGRQETLTVLLWQEALNRALTPVGDGELFESSLGDICRRLLESSDLLIPCLVDRECAFSGVDGVAATNQTHREWIYRQAFELGRHVIGYEIQIVQAAIDAWINTRKNAQSALVKLIGVGEGGRTALYTAALDDRIGDCLVSGAFGPREAAWSEPIDRNVWRQLVLHGDAEVASLMANRRLVVEAAASEFVPGPLPVLMGRRGGAAPGTLHTIPLANVQSEIDRAQSLRRELRLEETLKLVVTPEGWGAPLSKESLTELGYPEIAPANASADRNVARLGVWPAAWAAQKSIVSQLTQFTQRALGRCHLDRDTLWKKAKRGSVAEWEASSEAYRSMVWDDLIGRLPDPSLPANPRSRVVLETDAYIGYEVLLDVHPDLIAGGMLLVPRDLQPNERRACVVCQHGLEGVPKDTIDGPGTPGYPAYKGFSDALCRQGYIVYAPQNPYRGRDAFRVLQRMSNPVGRSLFSYILCQHQQTLDWLATLPFVDGDRIAFYGLSYGGKTAVRVPPLLKRYCLSICSADFNEWVAKNASIEQPFSYMYTGEYEIFEWNMGRLANYAELSQLMAPRPFMVERGHDDGVGIDEWVAWEYAKVRRFYNKLGLGDRTEIEFFDGPHTINGQGTFAFLKRWLSR